MKHHTRSARPLTAAMTLTAVLLLYLPACATRDTDSLMIDTRNVLAVRYMPGEITSMLDDLGYRLIADPDPAKTAELYGEYRMQFQAREAAHIMIDVHIKIVGNDTFLHLYTTDENVSEAVTTRRFRALKKRVERQFGAENVRGR